MGRANHYNTRRDGTIALVPTKSFGNDDLHFSTTNPEIVYDALEAREMGCTYGKIKAKEHTIYMASVEETCKHIDRSKYKTVRERGEAVMV